MLEKDWVKKFYVDLGGHGFDHVERVHAMSLKIAKDEKADLDVIDAASWLHDIARAKESSGEVNCHAEEGSKMAELILKEIGYSDEKISKIKYAIEVHRFSKNKKAETIEAQILQDADRLDSIGAVAISRTFMQCGLKKIPLHDPNKKPNLDNNKEDSTAINHFNEKILKLKPETFHTPLAKELAKERYKFVELFLQKFKEEWDGNS